MSNETDQDILDQLASMAGKGKVNIPPVEVIENGRRVTNPRMDPSIMNFLLLSSIASQAVKVRKYVEDRTPNGRVRTYDTTVTEKPVEVILDFAAQSIAIFNDGADTVYIKFNEDAPIRPITLHKDEPLNVNFETHIIKWLWLKCANGKTASVRITAKD